MKSFISKIQCPGIQKWLIRGIMLLTIAVVYLIICNWWIKKSTVVIKTKGKTESAFESVVDYPEIKDSTKFISDLRKIFNLEVDESRYQNDNEKITVFMKLKLYGSDNDYFFIEYDYADGCGAAFPWKYQLLLNAKGELVKRMAGIRYEFIKIFENDNPFLMLVNSTSKGNGGHSIYKVSEDSLEDVYEADLDYFIRTYDSFEDNSINEPYEMTIKVNDNNNDGLNDISFNGSFVLIKGLTKYGDWYDGGYINGIMVKYSVDNPFKEIPVELIFIYDKKTGHFKAKQDYSKVYKLEY
jgi:hypothetical protein